MTEDAKTKPLMTKATLIEHIGEAYEALALLIQELSDQEMMEPIGDGTWSWKDTLAHIAAWEQILVRFHIGGEPFDQVIEMEGVQYGITSFDDINEHLFQTYRKLSIEETRSFMKEAHAQAMLAVESFPEDELHQLHPRLSKGPSATVTWIDYIAANTYEHYEEHLDTG